MKKQKVSRLHNVQLKLFNIYFFFFFIEPINASIIGTKRKRQFWEPEEENLLISRYIIMGSNWSKMSADGMIQKTQGQLKDKWRNMVEKYGTVENVLKLVNCEKINNPVIIEID